MARQSSSLSPFSSSKTASLATGSPSEVRRRFRPASFRSRSTGMRARRRFHFSRSGDSIRGFHILVRSLKTGRNRDGILAISLPRCLRLPVALGQDRLSSTGPVSHAARGRGRRRLSHACGGALAAQPKMVSCLGCTAVEASHYAEEGLHTSAYDLSGSVTGAVPGADKPLPAV